MKMGRNGKVPDCNWLYLTLLFAAFHCVTSLQCYDCVSLNDTKCKNGPFDDFVVTCAESYTGCAKIEFTVMQYYFSEYEEVEVLKKNGNTTYAEKKLKFKDYQYVANEERVARFCAKDRETNPYKKGCLYTTGLGGDINIMTCYCPGEECNGSDVLCSTVSTVLFFTTGWLLWCWIQRDGVIP